MSADLDEWSGGGRAWFSSSLQMWFVDWEWFWSQVAIFSLLSWITENTNGVLHDWWPLWGYGSCWDESAK